MDASLGSPPSGMILDPEVLSQLRVEMGSEGEAVITEVLESFHGETNAQLQKCRQATAAGEFAKAAHRLRGSALNVGATALSAICAQAEAAGNAGDLAGGQALVPAMERILMATVAALNRGQP
jgi:HPt (histidine-containing phosphotransfer) domain-containing protein